MQATISLMAEFPLLHEEVEQVLTHMLEDYKSLPEDMISFEVGRATWEGMLNSEYAVFVSSDRVLFLARDEVTVQVSDSDISNSDEEVSISLQLCDQNMEAEMTTSDIRQLTMWIESE